MGRYLDLVRTVLAESREGTEYELNELNELSKPAVPSSVVLLCVPRDVPPEWFERVRQIVTQAAPPGIPRERWTQIQTDAWALLRDHGAAAARLGWTALDLFGCHPSSPLARLDCMGLALILRGRTVIGLDAGAARIATEGGALTFRRREYHPPETVAIWGIA